MALLRANTGIGTTNPTSALHVFGDGRFTGVVTATSFSGNATSATYATTAGIATYASRSGIATYSSIAGIATNVSGGIASVTELRVSGISTLLGATGIGTDPTGYYSLEVKGRTWFLDNNGIWIDQGGFGPKLILTGDSLEQSYSEFSISGIPLILKGQGIEYINLSYNGAGFGTATPQSKYHFVGDTRFDNNLNVIGIITATAFVGDGSGLTNLPGGGGQSYWASTSAGIHTLSNVGIGTTNPTSTLSVKGNTSLETLNVSGISTFKSDVYVDGRLKLNYLQYEDDSAITDFFYVAPDNHIVTAASDWTLKLKARASGANEGNLWLEAGQNTKIKVKGNGSNIDLIASDGSTSSTWNFNKNGQLTFPDSTIQTTAFVGYANTAGIATVSTKLQNARTITITGDVVGSVSFDGSSDVSIASTIQPNSVALGSDTTGDYVQSISGTSNQITVTGGTGESSTPTLSIPNQFTAPQDVTVIRDLQVNRNLNVTGNITIGGTTAFVNVQELKVYDPDIVLGVRTDGNGNDVATDNTANHGGIAIASTEGNPLVQIYNPGIGESTLPTYKKFMWFKAGTFAGLGTDAWLSNYAVGIGSTQFPTGTRLAVGNVQFTQNDLVVVRNINASGIVTASSFSGNATSATYATSAGVSTSATTAGYATTSGISTTSQGLTGTPNITVGVVTATSYNGSGTNLTGIVTSIVAGTNITVSGSTGQVTINSTSGGNTSVDLLEIMLFT